MSSIDRGLLSRKACISFIEKNVLSLSHAQLVNVLHIIRGECIYSIFHEKNDGIYIRYDNMNNKCLELLYDFIHSCLV